MVLCLGRWRVKIHGRVEVLLRLINDAKLAFKLENVILEGVEEPLCVLWGDDDPRLNFCFRNIRHHADEIHHKFRVGMGNDGKVRVDTLCRFFGYFNVDCRNLWLFFFRHGAQF